MNKFGYVVMFIIALMSVTMLLSCKTTGDTKMDRPGKYDKAGN